MEQGRIASPVWVVLGLGLLGAISTLLPWIQAALATFDGLSLPHGYVALAGSLALALLGVRGIRVRQLGRFTGGLVLLLGCAIAGASGLHVYEVLTQESPLARFMRPGNGAYAAGVIGACAAFAGAAILIRGIKLR